MNHPKGLILNIILAIFLIFIVVYEGYFPKIINKLKSKEYNYFKDNSYYQQQLNLYKAYSKKGNVVMLGNSITFSVNWNELLNRTDVINRGIGRDVSLGMLSRLEQVYDVDPQICFVMGGINDLLNNQKEITIINNLIKIIEELKQKGITPIVQSIIFVSNEVPNYKEINLKAKRINDALNRFCKIHKITYVNLNTLLSENQTLKKQYTFDGIHLKAIAYKKWGETIEPIINDKLD